MTTSEREALYKERTESIASFMFGFSVVFVVLFAVLSILWVDIPRVAGTEAAASTLVAKSQQAGTVVLIALLALWPLFWIEYFHDRILRKGSYPNSRFRLLACLIPPLRLAALNPARENSVWLPGLGWRQPGRALSIQLERMFSVPMLIIALLILPILILEFGMADLIKSNAWLGYLLHTATGFIWCAFTLEFIVRISATRKRVAYAKAQWVDLIIILVPLISFLRAFQVLRLARLQQITKMGRIFRMRGIAVKTMQSLTMLEVINRALRITPEQKLERLKLEYEEQTEILKELEEKIAHNIAQVAHSGESDQSFRNNLISSIQ